MNQYPKKEFGEITLKGGLNNIKQTLKAKYLLPTKDYPTGKAVIEIIVPDNINSFSINNDKLKDVPEIIEKLSFILEELQSVESREIIANQISFNKMLFEDAQKPNKPFVVKSFRFNEKDFVETHILMNYLAKLFGYLFYKYKTEIEKESNTEHLVGARNAVASTMSNNVYDKFVEGFMEGLKENLEMKVKGVTNHSN